MEISLHPIVSRPFRCRLGLHGSVPLPKPEKKFMRTFVVRSVEACPYCGRVLVRRFTNIFGGGGVCRSGWVDPSQLPKEGVS